MFCNVIHISQPCVFGAILVQQPMLISYKKSYSLNRQQKHGTCLPCYDPISSDLFLMMEVTEGSVGLPGPGLVPSFPTAITSIPIPEQNKPASWPRGE